MGATRVRAAVAWLHVFVADACFKPAANPPEFVISPRSHEVIDVAALPTQFDWRDLNGTNYVTAVRNQQLPQFCGSCWAFSATSALSDRLYFASGGRSCGTTLAPQVLLDFKALPPSAGSCDGGDQRLAYEFIRLHGISDEACNPYRGLDGHTCEEGLSESACMCKVQVLVNRKWIYKFTEAGPRFGVVEHGRVLGEAQMMAEIFRRGPIACNVHAADSGFIPYDGVPEILSSDLKFNHTDHAVETLGWGEDSQSGLPYWIGKNSFGTAWGLAGFFKLRRGRDDLKMESSGCAWAVPTSYDDAIHGRGVQSRTGFTTIMM